MALLFICNGHTAQTQNIINEMGEWLIYGSNGTQKATVKKLEYSGEFMGETSVTCDIYSPSPISFSIGDYLVYRGERFTIDYDATRLKQARNNTYGKGYTYENMRFLSYVGELKKCEFLDFVPSDNLIHFSQLPDFFFYAETVKDLADRLQANLDRIYTGSNAWSVQVVQGFEGKENINVSVSKATCFDALRMAYDQFEATFIIRGRTITIGTAGNELETDFKYGKGNGLKTIERSVDESDSLVTRLRAYGNTTNLPANYYKNIGMRVYAPIYEIYHVSTTGCDIHFVPKLKNACFSDKNGQYSYWVTVSLDETLWLKAVASPNNHLSSTAYSVVTVGLYGSNTQAQVTQFLQQLQSGTYDNLYFKQGINVGAWPVEYREYAENVPNLMAIDRLMLPGFPELTTDPYIDASNISTLGVREKSVYFDGSDPDTPDIHPTLEGMTAAELRAAGYTIDLDAGDNGNLDEIAADATETDGNPITADGAFEGVDEVPGFKVTIKDIGFDINDYLSTETATLVMKTGMCGGREFTIVNVEKVGNKYVLECQRTEDVSHYFPYNPYLIKAGDKFVLTNIEMPKAYIDAASQRLLAAAQAYIAKYSAPQWVYAIKMDDIWMQRQRDNSVSEASSYYWNIKEGDVMNVTDSDLGVDISEVIDRLTIREGYGPIPEFEVVLRKEKPQGTIGVLQNRIRQLELRNAEQVDIIRRQQNYLTFIFGDTLADVMSQLDKKAETWYQANDPSSAWTNDEDKAEHVGDLWMDTSANGGKKTYIYQNTGTSDSPNYQWVEQYVPDEVFDEIDGKAEIFIEKPTSYNERDMWIIENGISSSDLPTGCVAGDIVISSTDSTSFNKAHWSKKDRYTDDSSLNTFLNGYTGTLTGIRNDITNAATAASNAQTSANNASTAAAQAKAAADALDYLKQAYLADNTLIDHGLILSTIVALRDSSNNVWSGISGAYDSTKLGNGIAAWYGGGMIDGEVSQVANAAKSLFRFDGSGYVASGNLKWDASGNVTIQGYSINATTLQVGGSNVATQAMLDNFVSKAFFNRLFTAYDANGNAIVPNDTTTAINNLKIMVGAWTEQYLSALGLNSEGGGGGTGTVTSVKIASNPDVFIDPVDGIIDMSSYATTWNNKQNTITDLATIRSNASHGNTAYSWGNHANAGYAQASDTVSNVAYNTTGKKLTKTINGNTTDIVSASTLVTDGGGAKASTTITAGNGLTGGGDLSSNRTINVVSANAAITVNADNIKLNVINDYTTTTNNTIIPLAAAKGKDLNDRLAVLESWFEVDADGNIKTKDMPNGTHRGFYTESFVSALGSNSEGGGSGAGLEDVWDSLTNQQGTVITDNTKIAIAHIPDTSSTYGYLKSSALNGYVNAISTSGSGNAVTSVTKSGNTITFTKGSTFLTSHQTLYTLSIYGGTTKVLDFKPNANASIYIKAGGDISLTNDTTNKYITLSYTHPTNGANTTISAANGKVLSAITVNSLGHVTSVSSKTLASADIPDISATYATASRATTLEGYFTNGVANSAAKLNTGTTTYTAWGQTYWSSGVPQSISGNMTSVGSITPSANGNALGTTSARFNIYGTAGNFSGNVSITGTLGVTGATTLSSTLSVASGITLTTTKRIYFGDTSHYLELDSTGFHFSHGVYSDSFVSALGANSSGGGSGTFDEEAMWTALDATNEVIGSAHIPNLSASKITSGTLAAARIPIATASAVGGIKVGTTLAISDGVLNQKSGIATAGTYRSVTVDTYGRVTAGTNPTTLSGYGISDAYTKTQVDNALSGYLPLSGGTLTGTLTTPKIRINKRHSSDDTRGGIYYYDGTTDYLLIGQGSANLWIGANETAGTHHTGGTFISAGSGDAAISRLVNGSRENYIILDAGNYSSYALPLSGGTLTGVLRVNNITASNSAGLLSYHPSDWTGVSNTQWGVGAADSQGVIRSGNYNLLHYNAGTGTSSTILDTNNTNVVNGVGYINGNAITNLSHLSLVSGGTLNSTAGSFAWSSTSVIVSGNDNVGIQIGDSADKWQLTADSHLHFRQNDSGGTNTANWGNWLQILDTGNYSSYALPLSGGTITGNLAVEGYIYLRDNNKGLYTTDTANNVQNTLYLNNSNQLLIGYGTAGSGYDTYIYGNNLYLRYGTSRTIGITLSSSGSTTFSGTIEAKAGAYNYTTDATSYGLNMNNSDIVGVNGIFTNDTADNWADGINFKRTDGKWDSLRAKDNYFYFGNKSGTESVAVMSQGTNAANGVRIYGSTYEISFEIGSGNVNRGIYDYTSSVAKWLIYFNASNTILNFGNVGIGTASPSYKLHVAGTAYASNAFNVPTGTTSTLYGYKVNGNTVIRGTSSDLVISPTSSSGSILFYPKGSSTSTVKVTIDNSGNILGPAEITASSDERLKTIVGDGNLDLRYIANAPNILFKWNNGQDDKVHGGSLAQYFLHGAKHFVLGNDKDYYSLNYGALATSMAISIAKEVVKHDDEITRLKKVVVKQAEEIVDLKNKVREFEERRVA